MSRICPFSEYLWSHYHVLGTVLVAEDIPVNTMDKVSVIIKLTIEWRRQINK